MGHKRGNSSVRGRGGGGNTEGLTGSKKCWRFEELGPGGTRVFSSPVFCNFTVWTHRSIPWSATPLPWVLDCQLFDCFYLRWFWLELFRTKDISAKSPLHSWFSSLSQVSLFQISFLFLFRLWDFFTFLNGINVSWTLTKYSCSCVWA